MIRLLYLCVFVSLVGSALFGRSPDKVDERARETKARVDAVRAAVQSNDLDGAKKAYAQIDWRGTADPAAELQALSDSLKGDKKAEDLRGQIKTMHELLKEDGAAELEDDIAFIPVPYVSIPAQKLDAVEIIEVDTTDEAFFAPFNLWTARFARQVDYYDSAGRKIVPAAGTVLATERKAVIRAVAAGGDYDVLWGAYQDKLQKAVGRRIVLERRF